MPPKPTDAITGAPDFMSDTLAGNRLGVIHLFAKLALGVAELIANARWRLYDLTAVRRFSQEARQHLVNSAGDVAIHRHLARTLAWDVGGSEPLIQSTRL